MKLKKIGVLSLAYTLAIIYFLLGIISAIFTLLGKYLPNTAASIDPQILSLGPWILIIFPILYCMMGFISGAIIGFAYNYISQKTGGIVIYLSNEESKKK